MPNSSVQTRLSKLATPPPWIWNTRAPYKRFLDEHKRINCFFRASRIAYELGCLEAARRPKDESIKTALGPILSRRGKLDLKHYPPVSSPDNKPGPPRISDFSTDLKSFDEPLYEAVLIRNSSLFESFIRCWFWNMLLATLEKSKDKTLTGEQLDLLDLVADKGRGNEKQMIGVFLEYKEDIEKVPHIWHELHTRAPKPHGSDSRYNALAMVGFWREFRNMIVHRSRIIDQEFYNKFGHLWTFLRGDMPQISPMKVGESLPLDIRVVVANLTTNQVLAKKLRENLIRHSNGKRGHMFAPGRPITIQGGYIGVPLPPDPPLFTEGDWSHS